ncbi:dynein beta chain, putative [Plasmodium gallinaceum]|uniref:Dynein beta chain, putative n=1 Tax=Plasmodium gallinaceum TaxID=5849 RepID=A0A1J1GQR5_PLAGA|nr:dynein beta chain, putative [Plasmodium gallinaceum]CRG94855.1 dynein beta chain, putative [Plasmodium gallinaceum]
MSEISEEFLSVWVKHKISFSKYNFNDLWKDDYNKTILKWINNINSKILFIYLIENDEIKLNFSFDFSNDIIDETVEEYIIFLKINNKKITHENIDNVILFNKIKYKIKENILNLMDRVLIPSIDIKNNCPTNIQNDFKITTIDFMSYITQIFSKNKLIYYPKITVNQIQLFANDKNYLQLLEKLLIHWIEDVQKLFKNIYDKDINYLSLCEYISDVEKKHNILKDLLEELNLDIIGCILNVLDKNNCVNVKKFNSLIIKIKDKCERLEEKLKALKILEEPFRNLQDNVSLENVYNILPIIVNRLKLIFNFSKYYKNSDELNSLITLLLNEFIKKLQNYIDLSKLYTKEVIELIETLDECVNFVSYWDYLINISFSKPDEKNLTDDSIINHINLSNIISFRDKCIDLKEICFACKQFLFCIKEEDIKTFSYEYYDIIKKGFNDIESTFFNELNRIRNLKYNILSINNNEWDNDFKKTKELIKVLESIFINLIKISFENSCNIENTIFLFDKFYSLSVTENIKSFMKKKVIDIWYDFIKYIESYSKYFNNFLDNPFNYFSHNIRYEYHSSCIMLAKNIYIKLYRIFDKLNKLYYIPKVKEQDTAYEKYFNFQNSLNNYIKQINNVWINELKTIASKKNNSLVSTLLDNSIIIKVKEKYLESTYNIEIKKVLSEVNFWVKIKDEKIFLPNVINELSFHEERLKISKEYVNRLVRNYNNICIMLNSDQYKIFEYILKNIYNNIENTVFKYNWNKDNIKLNILFNFLNECIHIKTIIATFKKNDEKIKDILNEIEKISIINIDEKRTYTLEEFEEEQNINIERIRRILRDKHSNITKILKGILVYIEKFSTKSLNSFENYIKNIEKNFQEKYFISLKVSLYNYYKLLTDKISNDAVENYPLFKIYVKLNKEKELIYDFSHQSAKNLTDEIYKKASDMFYNFPKFSFVIFKNRQKQIKKRIAFVFNTPNANEKDMLNDDKENQLKKNDNYNQCNKLLSQINNIYVNFMEKLKEKIKWLKHYNLKLLNLNENELLKNLHSSEDTMKYVYNEISVFKNLEENVKQDIDKEIILFIEINLSILKEELLSDFSRYKKLFLDYISEKCKNKLEELYYFFRENSNNLLKMPEDINDLKKHYELLEYCNQNYTKNKKELDKLEEDYLKLIELKGELNEDEIMKLKTSSTLSSKFESLLKESKTMYLDTKEKMKNEIKNSYNEFNKIWQKKKSVFYKEIPVNINNNPNDVLNMINFYENELKNIKMIQEGLKNKINLFNIDDVCDEQIKEMQVDLIHLKNMWQMIKYWHTIFDFIKNVNIFYLYDILNDLIIMIKEYKKQNLYDALSFLEEKKYDIHSDNSNKNKEIKINGDGKENEMDIMNKEKLECVNEKELTEQNNVKNLNIKTFLNQLKIHFVDIFEQFLITMKGRNTWEIYKELKNNVGKLKFSLILVEILTSECMKFRHFKEIELKTNIEWNLNNITLNDIIEHKLYKEIKFITILYNNAEKESIIENNLKKIINKYEDMKIKVQNYKSSFLIHDIDNIFNNINEDLFLLNNIKIYNFDINFLKKTEKWENTLGNLYDNLEILYFIQNKNEYLKSILSSSDEMKPHLKKIYEEYNICDQKFIRMIKSFENSYILDKINNNDNVRVFLQIQKQLNFIEKSLETYLEKKKSSFPRFYFLSNKEILEILGIYKNPLLLKKKIQKIFSSIYSIEFSPTEKKAYYQKNNSKIAITHDSNKSSFSFMNKKSYYKNSSNLNTNEKLINREKGQEDILSENKEDTYNLDNFNNSSYFDIYIFSQYKEKVKLKKKMALNYESSTIILKKLEENIYDTLKIDLVNVQLELKEKNLKNWILNNTQQLVLASKCINFTNDYEYFLIQINKGSHIFVNQMKKENNKELIFLTDLIKTIKDKKNFIKISALIILESYYKDVAEKLIKNKIECNDNFLWMCQLKYILTEDENNENLNFAKILSSNDIIDKNDNVENQTKHIYKKYNSKNEFDQDLYSEKNISINSDAINTNEKKKHRGDLGTKIVTSKNDIRTKNEKQEKSNENKINKKNYNSLHTNKKENISYNRKSIKQQSYSKEKSLHLNEKKYAHEKEVEQKNEEELKEIGKNEKNKKKEVNHKADEEYEEGKKEEKVNNEEEIEEEEEEDIQEQEEYEEHEYEDEDENEERECEEREKEKDVYDEYNDDYQVEEENEKKEEECEEVKDKEVDSERIAKKGILQKKKKSVNDQLIGDIDNAMAIDINKGGNINNNDVTNKNNKQLKYFKTINLMLNKSMTLYLHYFNNKKKYAYEYQGNTTRLVITPLTEKCFYSCLFSLDNYYVNAIKGETGVGKSETIKDFSKIFGSNIISINCNNNNTSKYIGNILSGILQSGFWCCFDEFNRIDERVIVIIVEQFRCIKHILQKFEFNNYFHRELENTIYEDISSYQLSKWKINNDEENESINSFNTLYDEYSMPSFLKKKENKQNPTNENINGNEIIQQKDEINNKNKDIKYKNEYKDTKLAEINYLNKFNKSNEYNKSKEFSKRENYNKLVNSNYAYFEGQYIKINNNCSIYLTLCKNNDNCLYSLENYNNVIQEFCFKPPNFYLICQFSLTSIGFKNSKKLSKKINICYSLLYEFLSKQEQYIIDLREIKKFLNLVSEDFMINNKIKSEEEIIYDALMEVNESKLLNDDLNIFYNFLKELFPLVKNKSEKKKNNDSSVKLITDIMSNMGYTVNDYYINKILKLHKIKKTNKGIVLVGKSCSGKTSVINIFKHYCEISKNLMMQKNSNIEEEGYDTNLLDKNKCTIYQENEYEYNKSKLNNWNEEFTYSNQINIPMNSPMANRSAYESYTLLYPTNLFSTKSKNQGNTNTFTNNISSKKLSKLSSSYSMQSKNSSGTLIDFSQKYKKSTDANDCSIEITVFNPMSTDVRKLYGYYNFEKEVYEDGILSLIMKRLFENNNLNEKWLILDGPLDILTTEPLHSLLDENKVLTLINGNRIKFADNVFIFFEIENLKNCAPSFISRSKIVYMNEEEFNFEWIIDSYLKSNFLSLEEKNLIQGFFNKYIKKIMNAKRNKFKLIIEVSDASIIISVCQLYDMLCNLYDKNFPKNLNPSLCLEKLFLQSIIYTFSNILCPKSKELLDQLIKSIDNTFPHLHTIFDYIISKNNFNWVLWDELITTNHNFLPNIKEIFSYENSVLNKNDSNMKYMVDNSLSDTLNQDMDFNKLFLNSNLYFSKKFNKYPINYNNLFSDSDKNNTLNVYETYHQNFLSSNINNINNVSVLDNFQMFSSYSNDNIYSNNNFLDSTIYNNFSQNLSNNNFSDNISDNNISGNILSYRNIKEKNNFHNMNNNEDFSIINENYIESYNKSSMKEIYKQKEELNENNIQKTKEKYFQQTFNDNIFIENVESLRKKNIISILMYNKKNILLIGNKFSGKTFFMKYNILPFIKEDISNYYTFISKLSNSNKLEKKIEMNVEKKCRNIYKPIENKKCLYFILDDLNNLQKYNNSDLNNSNDIKENLLFDFNINTKSISKNHNNSVSNSSIFEFLNQFIDYNIYYNKDNGSVKNVENLFFFLIYGNNKKYTSTFNRKLINRLHIVHLNEMDEATIKNTFNAFLRHKFSNFHEVIKNLSEPLSSSTVRLFFDTAKNFKPNLNCYHYFFHLTHIFKIIKGLFLSEASIYEEKESVLRLWVHECFRVLGDQLILKNERKKFKNILKNILHKKFYVFYNYLFPKKKTFYFCSYNFHDTKNEKPYFFYQSISNENALIEFFKSVISSYNTFTVCNYDKKKKEYFKNNNVNVDVKEKKKSILLTNNKKEQFKEIRIYENFKSNVNENEVDTNYYTNNSLNNKSDLKETIDTSLNKSFKTSKEIEKLINKNDNDFNNINNPINFILFKEVMLNICKISRIFLFENEHFISIGDSGPGKFTCCLIACFIYQIKIHVIKNFYYGSTNMHTSDEEDRLIDEDTTNYNSHEENFSAKSLKKFEKQNQISDVNKQNEENKMNEVNSVIEGNKTNEINNINEENNTGEENKANNTIEENKINEINNINEENNTGEENNTIEENKTNEINNINEENNKDEENKANNTIEENKINEANNIIEENKTNEVYLNEKTCSNNLNNYNFKKNKSLNFVDNEPNDNSYWSKANTDKEDSNKLNMNFLNNNKNFSVREKLKCNYFIKKFKDAIFNCYKNEKRCILYYLDDSISDDILEFLHEIYNNEHLINIFNSEEIAFLKNIFLQNEISFNNFDTLGEMVEDLIKRNYHYILFTSLSTKIFRKISNEYNIILKNSTVNYFCPWKNTSYNIIAHETLKINSFNIDIFSKLHGIALKTFENIIFDFEEKKYGEKDSDSFLNEFINHMECNDYNNKNANEKQKSNIKYNYQHKNYDANVTLCKSKNILMENDKHSIQINSSLQMNTKDNYTLNTSQTKINMQNKKTINDGIEENLKEGEDKNEDEENNIKYIKNSKIVEDKLNIQKYINFKHFFNFLQFFEHLYKKKLEETTNQERKINIALSKLADARNEIQEMQIQLSLQKENISKKQTECAQLLKVIEEKKKESNEKKKKIQEDSIRISSVEIETQKLAEDARKDLQNAIPELEVATQSLEQLDKKSISEVKAYTKPPDLVMQTLSIVMIILNKTPSWEQAKIELGDANFLNKLKTFDKDSISDKTLKKIEKFTKNPIYSPKAVKKVSSATGALCMWVHALKMYAEVYREVAPKRLRLKLAEEQLTKNRNELKLTMEQLDEIKKTLLQLQEQHNESTKVNNELSRSYEESCLRIENVEKFLLNLIDEKNRWQKYIKDNERIKKCIYGESILSSFFLVYTGLLNYEDRKYLIYDRCVNLLIKNHIYVNTNFNVVDYFIDPIQSLEFNNNFLSNDIYMKENSILINNNFIATLIIDPHYQATNWIKRSYNNNDQMLVISDFHGSNIFLKIIYCMNKGIALLINSINEELEDILLLTIKKYNKFILDKENNTILDLKNHYHTNNSLIKEYIGRKKKLYKHYCNNKTIYEEKKYCMKLQLLNRISIHRNFKLFLVSNKNCFNLDHLFYTLTTVIVFNLNKEALDNILLTVIINNEEKNLEDEKKESLLRLVHIKKEIVNLENNVLENITKSQNKITEDDNLIKILLKSKSEIDEKNGYLEEINDTLNRINMNEDLFKPLAKKVSILFTILNDLKYVNNFYQFSLDIFINFFTYSINDFKKNNKKLSCSATERQEKLFNYFFYEFIKYTKFSLSNKHHLFFIFYSLCKIMVFENKISQEDYNSFIFGNQANFEKIHSKFLKKKVTEGDINNVKGQLYNKRKNYDKNKKSKEKLKCDDEQEKKGENISDSYDYVDDEEINNNDEDYYEEDDFDIDENDGDENDGDENDGDENDGDNNDGDDNEGNEYSSNEDEEENANEDIKNDNFVIEKINNPEDKKNNNDEDEEKIKNSIDTANNKKKRQNKKKKHNLNSKLSNEYMEDNFYEDYSEFNNLNNKCTTENEEKNIEIINPGNDWISNKQWMNLLDIEKLKNFGGFINSFIKSIREWRRWFNFLEVESYVLPDEWEFNLNSFQKLIIIKILRPDRLNKAIENFIYANISYNDIEVDHMNFEYILKPSKNIEPLTIIYKSNYDPFQYIYKYAHDNNQKLKNLTLTNENINFVYNYLRDAMEKGHILYISNLHNSVDNLLKLTKIIENILNNESSLFNSSENINIDNKNQVNSTNVFLNNCDGGKKEEMTLTKKEEKKIVGKNKESISNEEDITEVMEEKTIKIYEGEIIGQEEIQMPIDVDRSGSLATVEGYSALIEEECRTDYADNFNNLIKKKKKNIKVHPKFRLFLSSLPTEKFPISLLQKSVIVILEEPHNIKRSISILVKEQWAMEESKNIQLNKYKKLLISLFWFHSILNNRKKFYNLGWNSENYFFSDKDVVLSKYISKIFLNKNVKEIYWPYYHYYICDIIYGSKINDYFDKQLLNIYAKEFFNNNIFKGKYIFSSSTNYYLPSEVSNEKVLNNYLKEIPHNDNVEIFGQKSYSEISFNSIASKEIISLLFNVNSLHLNHYHIHNTTTNNINEKQVYSITKILLNNLPREIYLDELMKKQYIQEQYIYVNLMLQEIYKHNLVLKKVRNSLNKVQCALKGEIVINKKIYDIIKYLSDGIVPKSWKTVYVSKKKILYFFEDLKERVNQLYEWSLNGNLQIYWLGGFCNPKSFLKYILHEYSKKNEISYDLITFEFTTVSKSDENKLKNKGIEEGIYIKKLVLQGAKWDFISQSLMETDNNNFYFIIPIVYLKVVLKKKNKNDNDIYYCPLYICQEKNIIDIKENYLLQVGLKTGSKNPSEWGKMGVRLFLTNEC